jgi:hypothetical protein
MANLARYQNMRTADFSMSERGVGCNPSRVEAAGNARWPSSDAAVGRGQALPRGLSVRRRLASRSWGRFADSGSQPPVRRLGGGLIKQRVARKGQGRSGGYRMMIAYRARNFSVFLFGFAKSDESNIDDRQLAVLRRVAASWLSADAASIKKAVEQGELTEVQR